MVIKRLITCNGKKNKPYTIAITRLPVNELLFMCNIDGH